MSKADGRIPTHLLVRHARVREALLAHKLDAVLLTCAADVGYVTGNVWDDCYLLLDADKMVLLTDSRYEEETALGAPWLRRRIIAGKQTLADLTADAVFKSGADKVGVEQNFLSIGQYQTIGAKLRDRKSKGRKPRLSAVNNLMVNVRKTKDAVEIETIRRAIGCAEDAYRIVRGDLRVGQTENDIAARLDFEMRRRGASGSSFSTNVSAGANSSLPHYRPKEARLSADSALLFDFGAVVDGYCSDITRTHLVGRPPEKLASIYRIVLEAQLAAIAAIRPGAMPRKVDKVARDIIRKAGYGKNFGHGLGHGIGLAVHELPRLSRLAPAEPLQPGMVLTVEPGIYLPGVGGVRIEDDVLVTESGCEVLTSLDKRFEGCHIE